MEEKELVSLVICSYNQEKYIKECVDSALSQTYSPLEIVISDDTSPDSTFDIIKEAISDYTGPHQIIINRNEKNLGVGGNTEKAIQLSTGQLIITCGGDDIFYSDRVSEIYKVWEENEKTGMAIFSNAVIIDENGEEKGKLFEKIPRYCSTIDDFLADNRSLLKVLREPSVWIHGATAAYSREVYSTFGPIPQGVRQEDGVLSFRALLLGGIRYIDKPLCKYRVHSDSISNRGNYKNVVKILKSEYLYFKTQLADAKKMNADKKVLKKVKRLILIAYLKRFLFSIPVINVFAVKVIKNVKKHLCHFI